MNKPRTKPTTNNSQALEPKVYKDLGISLKDCDEDALKIITRLKHSGFIAYIVGGGVRDLLLKKRPKDFDIATDATPRQVKALFRNSRIIGRRFRLVHVYFSNRKFIEVSTFRATSAFDDIETPGNVDNEFGDERTDAVRRDITINALYFDPENRSVIDYVGGVDDIRGHTIRIIGEPDIRFKEDPVRLVRVVRHAARSGFEIESSCWDSLQKNANLILESAPMRLYEEFKKDLVSGSLSDILWLLGASNVLSHIISPLAQNLRQLYEANEAFSDTLAKIDSANSFDTKLPHTIPLLLLAFFLKSPMLTTTVCSERFDSKEDIETHLKTCFGALAVTRRDREMMQSTLNSWRTLSATNKLPNHLRDKEQLEEILELFESPDSEKLLDIPLVSMPKRKRRRRRKKIE